MDIQEFLKTLFGSLDESWLEITCIAPPEINKYPRTLVMWKEMPLTFADPKFTKLHQLNEQGQYGIYFGLSSRREKKQGDWRVNPKTGEKRWCATPRGWAKDTRFVTCLWAETDAKDFDGDMDAAKASLQSESPSVLVKSGGGWHGYWLLDTPIEITDGNRGEIKRALRGLALSVKGDSHVAELARIFRLPDTINTKPDRNGVRCEVVEFTPRYTPYESLRDLYLPLVPERKTSTRPTLTNGDTSELEKALFCIPPTKLNYDEWFRVLIGLGHSLGVDRAEEVGERWTGWCSQSGEVATILSYAEGDSGGSIATIGSVFHLARQYGYQAPKRETAGASTSTSAMTNSNKRLIGETIGAYSG